MTTQRDVSPLISIVIPAYNYAHTLRRAIDSVLAQMTARVELLVVNDGSTDATPALLQDLQAELSQASAPPAIRIFHKPNGGLASVRNFGIAHSHGDYLIFLDADDECAPGAIAAILAFIQQQPNIQFIIGGHQSISAQGRAKQHMPAVLPDSPYDRVKQYLIDKKLSLSNGACVMHRSIFANMRYPEAFRNSEDIPVFTYVLANMTCANLPQVLAHIHKHDDSLRHRFDYTEQVGAQLIDAVFDPERIPVALLALKPDFAAQRYLSLSRVAYESQHYAKTRQYYGQALRMQWRVVLKWSYLKKFLRACMAR